jgi:hypothetical protein
MTAPNDQFVDIASRGQEAVVTAVRTWIDTMQGFAGTLAADQSQRPDLPSVVEHYFDFAEKLLANQRQLVEAWATGTAQAADAATVQIRRTTRSDTAHTFGEAQPAVNHAARPPG